jgi:dephospho-CoA kinase
MKWIGLTGGIGSGKSTVASILKTKGWVVIHADQIVHQLQAMDPLVKEQIFKVFGRDVGDGLGGVDRKKLGSKVFADKKLLEKLEQILHPKVRAKVEEIRKQLEQQGQSMAFYEVPLLFEKGMEAEFDLVLVVRCESTQQVVRLKVRDSLDAEAIAQRQAAQWDPKVKAAKADYVIDNSGSIDDLIGEVDRFLARYQDQE